MRLFLAGLISGFIGFVQVFVILAIESHNTDEKSGLLASDVAFFLFALILMAEIVCVIALSMYRISPWILRLLCDDWEAERVKEGKKRYGAILQHVTVYAVILRRVVVMIDTQSFSGGLLLSLAVALLPFAIPKPKTQRMPTNT